MLLSVNLGCFNMGDWKEINDELVKWFEKIETLDRNGVEILIRKLTKYKRCTNSILH